MSTPNTPHTPHTPVEEFRSILQLSKPFLSKEEITHCYQVQDITTNERNKILHVTKKIEIIDFLKRLIKLLKFPTNVLQLTMYYYQRFLLFNNFELYKNSLYEIAVTSLYISSKLLDYIKKLRDILRVVNDLKMTYSNISEPKILSIEKQFLQTINFDFRFQNSEDLLMRMSIFLKIDDELRYTSWLINNDTYFTDLHLRYPCNVVALLSIELALKIHQVELEVDYKNFKIFKDIFVTESIQEILQFYMDHYNSSYLSLQYESRKQEIMDLLITLKIGINKQIKDAYAKNKKTTIYQYDKDEFFRIERNFNKSDNVRFVYQKLNYIDEL